MQKIIVILLTLAMMGCSVSNVSYQYDRNVDLSSLRTFQFSPMSRNLQSDKLFAERIEASIDNCLLSKGYTSSANSPDFTIKINRSKEFPREGMDWQYPNSYYRGHYYYPSMNVYDHEVETVSMDFFSAATGKIIWHSDRTAPLMPVAMYGERGENADKTVKDMLANFPSYLP